MQAEAVPSKAPPEAPAGNIVIGHYAPMTGPQAMFGIAADRAIRLAVDERNALQGIHGRTIELVTIDDEGKTSKAADATKRLIEEHKVVAIYATRSRLPSSPASRGG